MEQRNELLKKMRSTRKESRKEVKGEERKREDIERRVKTVYILSCFLDPICNFKIFHKRYFSNKRIIRQYQTNH